MAAPEDLTPREREIAELVRRGVSRKRIADRLGIAVHTVNTHMSNLADKVPGDGRLTARVIEFLLNPPSTRAA